MKSSILLLLGAVVFSLPLSAQTNISTNITTNTTWTVASSPYVITKSINVNAGITLTVEAGVEVRFNYGVSLQVIGTLSASGTKFTANGSTVKGFWDAIYVSDVPSVNGTVILNNCTVEYASNIYIRKGTLTLNSCTINNFSSYGVMIHALGTLNIENTSIRNTSYPICFYGPGKLNPGNNVVLTGNTNDYIYLNFQDITSVFYLRNLGIPYYNTSKSVIETGTLIIDPGVSVMMANTAELTVKGKIKAIGAIAHPIIFDKHPTATYWYGINITASSIDSACVFKNCILRNTTYNNESYVAMEINAASPTFENCIFTNNCRNLIVRGISQPVFTNCVFNPSTLLDGESYNVAMDMNANLDMSTDSIKFNNIELRTVRILPSTVIDNAHLKKISFKNIENITYCLYETTTVHDTASLIIDPGVVIKCRNYSSMITANGTLTGIGSEADPIVFTHIADDGFGNPLDSQNDGAQSITNSNSGRLALYGLNTSKIKNWKIHYAGYNSDNWAIYVSKGNIVENCEIKNSYRGICFSDNAQILYTSFLNIYSYPLGRLINQGNPVLIGNTIINNVANVGILLVGFGTDSPTIKSMDFVGFTNVAYFVESPVTIPAANVISVDPGVVIKFQPGAGFLVNGALKAIGKKNNKIIFTSVKDDSQSGDSNNDGTATIPESGDWDGIDFSGTASDIDNILKNCEFRYSGYYGTPNYATVRITDCRVFLDSIKINFSNTCALAIYGGANPVITNSQFYNLSDAPIYMDMFSNPTFTGNKVANVPRIGLLIHGQTISGTVPVRSFAGYDTITYIVDERITVTGQLTIPAGLTFKGSGVWDIRGRLDVQGTTQKPVVFTTLEDDLYGNPKDMQQNGNTTPGNSGNHFVFYDESNDLSTIDHALFRYSASYPVQMTNASPKILNTTFENIAYPGISLAASSSPSINGCTFNNASFPFTTSLLTYPSETTGNIITGTTGRAIRVSDETLTRDALLIRRNFAGITNIPYVFQNYTVGTNAILTISPGVVCKFMQNGYLNIHNGLVASGGGTPDSTIVFTSDLDDYYGGDTYGDGYANQAGKKYWNGIYFFIESIDHDCILKNCILKNGSYYDDYYPTVNRGAITLNNASPTLVNCLFKDDWYGIVSLNTSLPKISNCAFIGMEPTNGYGIWNQNSANTVTAEGCWWNSNTGPRHFSNPGGTGERVSDYVDFTPWKINTQSINLNAGWNIFSLYVIPDDISMMHIVQPLIDAGILVKVQNETGAAIEYIPALGIWIDNIGNWSTTEGYKIRVNQSTNLAVSGTPISEPVDIGLLTGWNIIGYPAPAAQNALDVLDELITSGSLVKVQDETGAAIEPMPLNAGWIDNIGNFEPGEGYKVRVASNDILTIDPSGTGGLKTTRPVPGVAQHFKTTWEGNGYDHMNVYLNVTTEDGSTLQPGDEIAVYDGNLCVGAFIIENQHQHQNLHSIIVSADDPTTEEKDGFMAGNTMSFKVWSEAAHAETAVGRVTYYTGYSGAFEPSGTTIAKLIIESSGRDNPTTSLGDNYPNPFSMETTIPYTIGETTEVDLSLYDVLGQRVATLVKSTQAAGSYAIIWDGANNNHEKVKPGIYFCRMVTGNIVLVKTIELID